MINVGAMVATMALDTKRFMVGMQKATRAIKPLQTRLVVAGQAVKKFARQIFNLRNAFIALAVSMAGRKVMGAFKVFQTALVDMGKVTNRSIAGIRKEVMALSTTLGTSTELMRGYYQVISAGVKTAAKQLNVLTVATKASLAAHIDQSEVIKGLTAIVDAYEGKVKDAAEAADILFTIERLGKTTVAELIPVIGSLASISATLKVSQDELGGSLAQLTKFIGSTAEAATQLKALYTALITPNTELNALFEEQGGVLKAIEKIGFIDVLKKMEKATGGNVEALKKLMEGRREALLGFLSLAKQGFEPAIAAIEEMGKKFGAMDKAFKEWKQTLAATYLIFRATLGKVMIEMGKELAPLVISATMRMAKWLEKYKDVIVATTRALVKFLPPMVKLVAAFVALKVIVGITLLFKGFYAAVLASEVAVLRLSAAMKANLVIIAGILAYKVGEWFGRFFDGTAKAERGLDELRAETKRTQKIIDGLAASVGKSSEAFDEWGDSILAAMEKARRLQEDPLSVLRLKDEEAAEFKEGVDKIYDYLAEATMDNLDLQERTLTKELAAYMVLADRKVELLKKAGVNSLAAEREASYLRIVIQTAYDENIRKLDKERAEDAEEKNQEVLASETELRQKSLAFTKRMLDAAMANDENYRQRQLAAAKKLAQEIANTRKVAAEEIAKIGMNSFELEMDRIKKTLAVWKAAGVDKVDRARWEKAEIAKINKEAYREIEESYGHLLERLQDLTADVFHDILTLQHLTWRSLFDRIRDMFIRTLSEMVAEALKRKIISGMIQSAAPPPSGTISYAGTAIGAAQSGQAGPGLLAAMLGLSVVMVVLAAAHKRREANLRAEQRRMEALAKTWRLTNLEIDLTLSITNSMEEAARSVNAQFEQYRSTLFALGASVVQLQELERRRLEVLEDTRRRLAEDFAKPLEEAIAKIDFSSFEFEMYKLQVWYEDQLDLARSLGQESVSLLREAYELARKQLILKEREMLLGTTAEALRIAQTIGLTPMELQLFNLEEWEGQMDEATKAIQEQMDAIPGIIANMVSEIAGLQTDLANAQNRLATAESRYTSAYTTLMERYIAQQFHLNREQAEALWRRHWETNIQYMKQYGRPNWNVEPWKSWFLGAYNLLGVYETVAGEAMPLIGTIPGEIAVINDSISEQTDLLAQLTEDIEEAGGAAATAYAAQFAALTESFLGGMQEIIRRHTMSDLEQGLYDLNRWYEDQAIAAVALGLPMDLLNRAYTLQREALLETAEASSEWQSVLESLEKQIFKMQTSLASPLDVLERMSIAEQDIIGSLGSEWKKGIFDLSSITPEGIVDLQSLFGTYLDLAGEAFQRPSLEYGNIYESVLTALEAMKGAAEEQVSIYEIQEQQLDAQLRIGDLLEDLTKVEGSLQAGIESVPHTGLYRLHEGEKVSSGNGETKFIVNLAITETKNARETGREAVRQTEEFLRSAKGRKMVQEASVGR